MKQKRDWLKVYEDMFQEKWDKEHEPLHDFLDRCYLFFKTNPTGKSLEYRFMTMKTLDDSIDWKVNFESDNEHLKALYHVGGVDDRFQWALRNAALIELGPEKHLHGKMAADLAERGTLHGIQVIYSVKDDILKYQKYTVKPKGARR